MDLVNKLNYLAPPHFTSASSFEDVTAVIVAFQQTYDAFIKISKALNKAASLRRSAATNLSKLLESMQGQLNMLTRRSERTPYTRLQAKLYSTCG